MINHDRIKERIRELVKVQRKYANFFYWFNREKEIKEIGITRILLENIEKFGKIPFHNLQISPKDPPDVLAETLTGKLVGIEVRELVDREAVHRTERGEEVFKYWTEQEVIKNIGEIIEEKDAKIFHGGPYEKIILLIHTDEPLLDYEVLKNGLSQHEFEQPVQINEVFLLFSYSPKLGYYPHIRLRFSANTALHRSAPFSRTR